MDEPHLLAAARYIERNPVRAGLRQTVEQWPWSSARAHLRGDDEELVRVRPMLDLIPDWASYLTDADADPNPGPDHGADHFHRHARTGRPLGSDAFIDALETRLGRALRPQKPGPKPKSADARTRDLFSGFSDE